MDNLIVEKPINPALRVILIVAAWLAVIGYLLSGLISVIATFSAGELLGLETILAILLRNGFQQFLMSVAFILFAVFITVYCLKGKGKILSAAFYAVLAVCYAVSWLGTLINIISVISQGLNMEAIINSLLDDVFLMGMGGFICIFALVAAITVLIGRAGKIFSIITSALGILYQVIAMIINFAILIALMQDPDSLAASLNAPSYLSAIVSNVAVMFLFILALVSAIVIKLPGAKKKAVEAPVEVSEELPVEEAPVANE